MGEIQQWARDIPSQRRHTSQATESGATPQMQQNGLGLIVACVSHADVLRANFVGDAAQEGVARAASSIFQRTTLLLGDGSHISRVSDKPQPLLARKRLDKARVLLSLGAAQ